jgi:hypothetical protein
MAPCSASAAIMRSGKMPWSEGLNDKGTKGDLTRCPFDAKTATQYKDAYPVVI